MSKYLNLSCRESGAGKATSNVLPAPSNNKFASGGVDSDTRLINSALDTHPRAGDVSWSNPASRCDSDPLASEFRGGFHRMSEQEREHSLKPSAAHKSVEYAPEQASPTACRVRSGHRGQGTSSLLPPKKTDKRYEFPFGANQPEEQL